ncbi:hypothetical protein NE237_028560 [Protea cynaroides]|uniref:Transmembrane protein n=1 Tax=Protea cynaroides TaxID=273540 RepID=A0A9Q0GS93_9MAGN|nr:hypothetical protein NE237_028560 [Protea cynaroides]
MLLMHTDMKLIKLLSWFLFFLLFSQIISRLACETTFSLTHAGSELSENIRGEQPEGSNARIIGMDEKRMGRRSEEVIKAVDRKGVPGSEGEGYNANRRPPRLSHSGASTFPAIPSLVMGLVLQVSIGLLPLLHFFF